MKISGVQTIFMGWIRQKNLALLRFFLPSFLPSFLSAVGVVFLAALSLAPAEGWARTGQLPIRPVEASSPFGFQQQLPDVPNGIDREYLAIDTGGSATCAIRKQDRGIDCWGLNELGQASPPLKGKFETLSVGGSVGCALTEAHRLVCWGLESSRPKPGEAKQRYLDVSVGEDHVCAIQAGKSTVACWGDNTHGQLNVPKGRFKAISSRAGKACGLRQSGELECWGDAAFLNYPRPAGKFKDVSVGTLHGCAVRADDGSIACWGNGYYGEDQPPEGSFESVTSGTDHTCGVRTDRTAVCWGRNQWGQRDIPQDWEVSTLMAGGAQTCGLDRDSHVFCRGSFAYNSLLFPHPSDAERSSEEQAVYPQFVDNFVSSIVTNFIGNTLGGWGDSADSGFLLFVGGLLGYNSDQETQKQLEKINNKLDALATAVSEVNRKSEAILGDLKTIQCDDKLGDLNTAAQDIYDANLEYNGPGEDATDTGSLMKRTQRELVLHAANPGYKMADLRPQIHRFTDKWYASVQAALTNIDKVLMGKTFKSSPLGVCLDKAFVAYQNKTVEKQFDDRLIYQGIYWIVQRAMAAQALGVQMLLDMNKFAAITALSDPAVEPATPVIPDGVEWQAENLCTKAKAHATDPNPRWQRAFEACGNNEAAVRQFYRNLVQQIEKAGAPYTDRDVILQLGSDLYGYKYDSYPWNPAINWLMLRSFKRSIPNIQGWFNELSLTQAKNDLAGHGDANIYFGEGDTSNNGTWQAHGFAWLEMFDNASAAGSFGHIVTDKNQDRITFLATTKAEIDDEFLFDPEIKDIAFWMFPARYNVNWGTAGGFGPGSDTLADMKCFAGSGIREVCQSVELYRVSKMLPAGGWYGPCGISCGFLVWKDEFQHYAQQLGNFKLLYKIRGSYQGFERIEEEANFWPTKDAQLYRMPALDVAYRTCTPSMVIANQGAARDKFRPVSGKDANTRNLPSRCGTDLDYFIDKMIQRPDVPGIDELVRKPVFPAGVN